MKEDNFSYILKVKEDNFIEETKKSEFQVYEYSNFEFLT